MSKDSSGAKNSSFSGFTVGSKFGLGELGVNLAGVASDGTIVVVRVEMFVPKNSDVVKTGKVVKFKIARLFSSFKMARRAFANARSGSKPSMGS